MRTRRTRRRSSRARLAATLDLTAFEAGEVISSDEVNHNFQELVGAVAARQARIEIARIGVTRGETRPASRHSAAPRTRRKHDDGSGPGAHDPSTEPS